MATRISFYEKLLDDPSLDDIDDWPSNYVCWLSEAFWNISKGRIPIYKSAQNFVEKHFDRIMKIASERDCDRARRVLKRYAPSMIPMALTQVIIHLQSKKCNDKEFNALLREYGEINEPGDGAEEDEEDGEEDEDEEEEDGESDDQQNEYDEESDE